MEIICNCILLILFCKTANWLSLTFIYLTQMAMPYNSMGSCSSRFCSLTSTCINIQERIYLIITVYNKFVIGLSFDLDIRRRPSLDKILASWSLDCSPLGKNSLHRLTFLAHVWYTSSERKYHKRCAINCLHCWQCVHCLHCLDSKKPYIQCGFFAGF